MHHNLYEDYYLQQAGSGLPVFSGVESQRGHGLGSILGGLLRSATPLLKIFGKKLGQQGLKSGLQVATDVLSGANPKEALKRRAKEGALSLIQQRGSGAVGQDSDVEMHDVESEEEEEEEDDDNNSKKIRMRALSRKHKRQQVPHTAFIPKRKAKRNRARVLTRDIFE